MVTINHTDRSHALLSASAASRWLACPPSAVAGEKAQGGERQISFYAEEGTFAHELSELYFAHKYQAMTKRTFNSRLKKMKESEYYNEELHDYVLEYVDMVEERINAAYARSSKASTTLMFEERLDYSDYAPGGFGTGDVLIFSGGVLEIIDLKFGKGVEVSAVENPQLKLYGLGGISLFDIIDEITAVTMTIIQPRLNNYSSYEMSYEELTDWGESIKPTANLAYKGKGEFNPGEHCRFCPIKATCRARTEKYSKLTQTMKEPYLIDKDELADLLFEVDDIAKWAKDVKDYAQEQAVKGEQYDGWKLVEGRSIRKYTDADAIAQLLRGSGINDEVFYEPPKLLSISKLEKAVGKKTLNDLAGEYIEKPEGKPTLVPESDKRKAINSADDDFDEITDN
mgnify:CR=1 FL=1